MQKQLVSFATVPALGSLVPKLVLLLGVAGWVVGCSGGNSVDYKMATDAQTEMETIKRAAREAGALNQAAKLYSDALRYEERGDAEFARGDYTAARTNYIEATGFYRQAQAAGRDLEEPVAEAEDPQRAAAAAARTSIAPLRTEAEKAGAANLAPDMLASARAAADRGERQFSAAEYDRALRSFQEAADGYRNARNRANQERLAAEADPTQIRNAVERLRAEMLAAKTAAEQSGSPNWATVEWQRAQDRESEGDRNFRLGTRAGYLQAQSSYTQALDAYRAAKSSAEAAIAADQAARATANSARNAMAEAKGQVIGTTTEKENDASYQSAVGKERTGEEALRTGEYRSATRLFEEATQLYKRAANQLAATRRTTEPTEPIAPPQEPPPAATDAAERQQAEQAIDRLIDQFERSLETGNLNAVVALREERATWEEFFKNVKDVEASIVVDRREITLADNTAQASFRVALSYHNKIQKKRVKNTITRDWYLERINNDWIIVESRIN